MAMVNDYFQVICPTADANLVELFLLAAVHWDDDASWDNKVSYDRRWLTANDGAYIYGSFPAGDNMRDIVATWISGAPSSSPMFDGLRIVRGNHRAMTDAEIDQLRAAVIVGLRTKPLPMQEAQDETAFSLEDWVVTQGFTPDNEVRNV